MNKYYIYAHLKPNTGEIFYIGKGCRERAYSTYGRSKWWHNIVSKYGYDIFILDANLSEAEAFKIEKKYIKRLGRRDLKEGTLVNLTDGGEGMGRRVWTKEQREYAAFMKTGERNARWNTKHTKAAKKKIRDNQPATRQIIDIETNIVYKSMREASIKYNIPYSTLSGYLTGYRPNKTTLIYFD